MPGNFGSLLGIGNAPAGIPWYTLNGHALIGKIFTEKGFVENIIVCDDPYWCEFEGGFNE